MSNDTVRRKRKSLLSIVEKLEKVFAIEQSPKVKEQAVISDKPYVLRPVEGICESSSPSTVCEHESSAESDKESEWSETASISDNQKGGVGPRAPLRCDVCGLRAYKSYRYINKTSAPQHLKNFVVPSVERFRVCKRCFSSRERCRQNLSLTLLKSKTSQTIHVRTPLGVTADRATNALEFLARDLKANVKSDYEDELLTCDETLGDEDDWGIDDNENEFPKMNGYKVKEKEPKISKTSSSLNSSCNQLSLTKNVGLVTVVRPQSGSYVTIPNCYTFYDENNKVNSDADLDALTNQLEEKAVVNGMVSNRCTIEPFTNDINSISSKLTLLDHAYAQPMPKAKLQTKKTIEEPAVKINQQRSNLKPEQVENSVKLPKSLKTSPLPKDKMPTNKVTLKSCKTALLGNGCTAVGERRYKHAGAYNTMADGGEKPMGPAVRTCGVVCHLCNLFVTKSYSCLTRENAPDKVKHLFRKPEVKMVKVCRKCVPYKKPKPEEGSNIKGKVVKGKALLKAALTAKVAKANKTNKAAEKLPAAKAKAMKLAQANYKSKAIVNAAIMKSNQKTVVEGEEKNDTACVEVHSKSSFEGKEGNMVNTATKNSPDNSLTTNTMNPPSAELERTATKLLQTLASAVAQNRANDSPRKMGELHPTGTFVTNTGAPLQIMYLSKESIGNSLEITGNVANSGAHSVRSLIGTGVRKIKLKGGCLLGDSQVTQISQGKGLVNLDTCATVMVGTAGGCPSEKNNALIDRSKIDSTSCQPGNIAIVSVKTEREEIPEGKTTSENITESKRPTETIAVKDEKLEKAVTVKNEKSELVQSPRTRNRVAQGLSTTSIITRKRSLSMSSEKSDHSVDGKKVDFSAPSKKRIINGKKSPAKEVRPAASTKSGSRPSRTGNNKVKEENSNTELKTATKPTAASSKKKVRSNIVCGACHQVVVKSYRCLTVLNSPLHIKPLFDKFDDVKKMLRICRRCLLESSKKSENLK